MSSDIEELPALVLGKVSFPYSTTKHHKITLKSGNKHAHIHRSCLFSYVIPSSYLLEPPNHIFNIETSLITTTTVPARRLTKLQLGRHNIRWQRRIRSALHPSSLAQGICSNLSLSLHLLLASLLAYLTRRAGTRRNNGSPRRPDDLLPRR